MDTKENILAGFASYILASGSPRRIEMMRRHGIEPLILPAQIEETLPPRHDMYETVMFLALKKAKWVENEYLQQARQKENSCQTCDTKFFARAETTAQTARISQTPAPVIIAADTIVYADEIRASQTMPRTVFACFANCAAACTMWRPASLW